MPVIYNVLTGQFEIVPTNSGGGGGGSYTPGDPTNWNPAPANVSGALDQLAARNDFKVERFTLISGDITNKYVVLGQNPKTVAITKLWVVGASGLMDYSIDFEINSSNHLAWNGLGLDGVLSVGDKIIVEYNV